MHDIIYISGELDAHLAPIGKEYLRNPKQDAEWESEGYNKQSKGLPGSSKRKQYYNKKVSVCFLLHAAVRKLYATLFGTNCG